MLFLGSAGLVLDFSCKVVKEGDYFEQFALYRGGVWTGLTVLILGPGDEGQPACGFSCEDVEACANFIAPLKGRLCFLHTWTTSSE